MKIQQVLKENGLRINNVMSESQAKTFILLLTKSDHLNVEASGCKQLNDIRGTLIELLCKRIDILPEEWKRKFTVGAILFIDLMARGNPGRGVFYLIDMLNRGEDKDLFTLEYLSTELYPFGTWKDEDIIFVVDNYVKSGKLKYSEIY